MRIAIAGYGLEGEQNYLYYSARRHDVTIVDEKEIPDRPIPEGAKTLLGEGVFGALGSFDKVIRTAGLSPKKIKTNGIIWSATNEFFKKSPAPIIGVTGTKGKGTTSSFIHEILKAAGKDVYLVGNIGVSALEILPKLTSESIVVYELSSFQLWDIRRSPHVAVVLPIEPDHLDVHDNFDDYIKAKANIIKYQSENDTVIFNKNNAISNNIGQSSRGNKIEYPYDIEIFESSIKLPGKHNIENASAAIAAARVFGINDEAIRQGLSAFKGLPHRLKFVARIDDIDFYDDSISTTPGSAVAAINSFSQPKILILGGSDKGANYNDLYKEVRSSDSMRAIITMGANGSRIANELREYIPNARAINDKSDMDFISVIKAAEALAQPGDVVILSPAAASFDMFKNYADRGDQFIAAVNQLRAV
jgi:UDP-N-acetylmuramoylalanine--D-glutamate ligase